VSGQRGEQAGAGEKREGARIGKGPTPGADPRKTSRCGWRLDLPCSEDKLELHQAGAVGADSLSRTLTWQRSASRTCGAWMQYNSTGAAAGYIFVCKYYSMRELKEGRDDKAKEMARKSDERESTEPSSEDGVLVCSRRRRWRQRPAVQI
jgi:hypothetical protein